MFMITKLCPLPGIQETWSSILESSKCCQVSICGQSVLVWNQFHFGNLDLCLAKSLETVFCYKQIQLELKGLPLQEYFILSTPAMLSQFGGSAPIMKISLMRTFLFRGKGSENELIQNMGFGVKSPIFKSQFLHCVTLGKLCCSSYLICKMEL